MPAPAAPPFDWDAAADSVSQAPPAMWIPLRRALRARRRLAVMARELPPPVWNRPSACPEWTRAQVLAHAAASDRRYHDILNAALNRDPLRQWQPNPGQPSPLLDQANRLALQTLDGHAPAQLADALEAGARKTILLCRALDEAQSLQPMGWTANGPALLEWWENHDHRHADDIVNGPAMMRSR